MQIARLKSIQELLYAAGYYKGAIDGIVGPFTRSAVNQILEQHDSELAFDPGSTDRDRRFVAAAQLIFRYQGREPGAIDGYWGNLTEGAFLEWVTLHETERELSLPRVPTRPNAPMEAELFPYQDECNAYYGVPGEQIESRLVYAESPFPLKLDWDRGTTTNHIRIHELCVDQVSEALGLIASEYGSKEIVDLGLDLYGGSYNHRRMRGGTSWSMHAYGCAIDWYPSQNGLITHCPSAVFCADEYQPWLDIWESVGFVSLGREIDRDWMHVQAARLR